MSLRPMSRARAAAGRSVRVLALSCRRSWAMPCSCQQGMWRGRLSVQSTATCSSTARRSGTRSPIRRRSSATTRRGSMRSPCISAGRLQQRVVEIPSPGSSPARPNSSIRADCHGCRPRVTLLRDTCATTRTEEPGGAASVCVSVRSPGALRPKQRRAVPDHDTLTGLPARRGIKLTVSQQVDGTGGVVWREHHPEAGGQQQDGVADRDSRFGPSLRCRARWVRNPGRVNQSWVERGSCLPSPPGCPGSRG